MGSISSHIMPLVITSLRGGYTDTQTHTQTQTQTHTNTHMHIHTLCGQDQFLETWYTPAAGQHTPGLKTMSIKIIYQEMV